MSPRRIVSWGWLDLGVKGTGWGGPRRRRLARMPGFLLARQRAHRGRELPRGDVRDGDALEHLAQVCAQGDPDGLQRLGGARVFDLLGALPANAHERALDRADDLRERHLVRRLRE